MIYGRRLPLILGFDDQNVLGGKLLRNLNGFVLRAVVNDDNLFPLPRLRHGGFQRVPNKALRVVRRN